MNIYQKIIAAIVFSASLSPNVPARTGGTFEFTRTAEQQW